MSRIGKQPVPIPDGIKVAIKDRCVSVEGPVGKLKWTHRPEIDAELSPDGKSIVVSRKSEDRLSRSLHGLTRSLIANMVLGCKTGYLKAMEIYGVGYGVACQAGKLTLNVGKSHPEVFDVPAGVIVEVQTPQARGETEPARFTVKGPDKQAVGELAARVRKCRPPEPYKGKGVRYAGEYIRRKSGKAFAGAGGA
jgi:large subunit ribosomal protein L6